MYDWKHNLNFDPLPTLLSIRKSAILYFVNRDLLVKKVESDRMKVTIVSNRGSHIISLTFFLEVEN